MWEFIEKRGGYSFFKYQDSDGKTVYNCSMDGEAPKTQAGYYSYAYLLSVKGVTNTPTIQKLFEEAIK